MFEKRVLEGTKEFYNKENVIIMEKYFSDKHSFVNYMQYVKKRIDEESKDRIRLLHISTEKPLMNILSEILITKYAETFVAEFQVKCAEETQTWTRINLTILKTLELTFY